MPGRQRPPPTLIMASEPVAVSEVVGRLPYASNATLLARLTSGALVVYKPDRGEQPLWDFPHGTLASREALAWELSEALGFGIVPKTIIVDGPFGRGSAQEFIVEDEQTDPRSLLHDGPADELWPFAIMDLVANNADRKLGHIIVEAGSGKLWGIDNGLMFHPEDKLRTILWGFAGRPLPPQYHGALTRLSTELANGLFDRVAELLDIASARALHARTARLLADPVHPEPPLDRPAVPWPMW